MLRDELQTTLKDAMKSKDMTTVSAVRLIIAGMKEKDVNARASGKEKADDQELLSMMQTMIKQRNESIKLYTQGNRQDLVEKEQSEINVIERFLPRQLTSEETEAVISKAITTMGATSIKDMGKIMAELKANYAGQIDFGKVSSIIKQKLS